MSKVLIAYYNLGEINKVAARIKSNFESNKYAVKELHIKLKEEMDIKKQFKKERKLELLTEIKSISSYDIIIIGTPVVSFTSVPAVNAFIRSLPKFENTKIVLFATGIGLPGKAIQKMSSLFSMNGATVIGGKVFSSIFDFDERKLKEVDVFFENLKKDFKIKNKLVTKKQVLKKVNSERLIQKG